ncbi:hypothetical protein GEV33_002721 [Tenebrio molitor]|uniref:Uncharacterized protein n=1 Tax=Tenebrio molitor TaxID=7067 RepID=A0A8J6LFT5_TENMO|nr:hypothetical protein GEV33_002721 [Tenebrio molitor]
MLVKNYCREETCAHDLKRIVSSFEIDAIQKPFKRAEDRRSTCSASVTKIEPGSSPPHQSSDPRSHNATKYLRVAPFLITRPGDGRDKIDRNSCAEEVGSRRPPLLA